VTEQHQFRLRFLQSYTRVQDNMSSVRVRLAQRQKSGSTPTILTGRVDSPEPPTHSLKEEEKFLSKDKLVTSS
jgi:hypothetical protein